jgi:hypothetical protein
MYLRENVEQDSPEEFKKALELRNALKSGATLGVKDNRKMGAAIMEGGKTAGFTSAGERRGDVASATDEAAFNAQRSRMTEVYNAEPVSAGGGMATVTVRLAPGLKADVDASSNLAVVLDHAVT